MLKSDIAFAIAWLIAVLAFGVMAAFAVAYDRFPGDLAFTRNLQRVDDAAFEQSMDKAEDIADGRVLIGIYIGMGAALLLMARRLEVALLALTALGRLANTAMKDVVERARPPADLVRITDPADGYGFPSGHAAGVLLFYGFAIYLAEVIIDQPLAKRLIQAFCAAVIVLTWLERIYVGAHWPSDVIGGALFGAAVLLPIVWLLRRLKLRSP